MEAWDLRFGRDYGDSFNIIIQNPVLELSEEKFVDVGRQIVACVAVARLKVADSDPVGPRPTRLGSLTLR